MYQLLHMYIFIRFSDAPRENNCMAWWCECERLKFGCILTVYGKDPCQNGRTASKGIAGTTITVHLFLTDLSE